MSSEHSQIEHAEEHESMSKSKIWKVFFILLGITVVEFIIALLVPETMMSKGFRNFTYIVLTLVKAFYIVAFFMHLKFEKYTLIVGILVSFIFILYFIVLMMNEGTYMNGHMNL
jgi:cytochrome c oxidase subunit IV